jgi:membrane protein DedA with SNARE-associated domain
MPSWAIRVRDFVQSIAGSIDGPGLMLVALADSSFLSFPEGNDILLVILSTGSTWNRTMYYIAMTILGSVAGCLLLYLVGRKGGSPLLRRRFSSENIARAERLYEKWGIMTVVVPSILPPPCPFKIFVLSAGVFRLGVGEFLLAVAIGRTIRYSMWGILGFLYGDVVKNFVHRNLPVLGVALFVIFAVCLTVLLILYVRRNRQSRREAAIPPE